MPIDPSRFGPDLSIIDDLVGVLLRRKLVIVVTTIGVLLATYGVLSYITEQYESDARLLVQLGRENTEVPITVEKGSVFTSGVQEEEVNSYVTLLQSRVLVELVVEDLGLDAFDFTPLEPTNLFERVKYTAKQGVRFAKKQVTNLLIFADLKDRLSDRDKVIKLVEGALNIQREGKSNVIYVAVRLPSAELANRTLASVIKHYFELHVGLRQSSGVLSLFNTQTEFYRDEFEKQQGKVAAIRQEWNLSSVDQQRAELLRRLNTLQSQANTELVEIARVSRERQAMVEALVRLPQRLMTSETVEPNPAILKLKTTLVDKRLQRLDVGARYDEQLPAVTTIDEAIDAVSHMLDTEDKSQPGAVTYVPHPFRLQFEKSLEEIDIKEAGLTASSAARATQIEAIQQQLRDLNRGEDLLKLADLELSVVQEKYLSNASRREQARTDQEFDAGRVANVIVLSPPTSQNAAVSPRKMLIMGVGMIAGLMLGFALALALSWTDDTIYSANDLRGAALPPYLGEFRMSA
jgi:uncharacterized protein involved in exopolysaccharide biosynthesis